MVCDFAHPDFKLTLIYPRGHSHVLAARSLHGDGPSHQPSSWLQTFSCVPLQSSSTMGTPRASSHASVGALESW